MNDPTPEAIPATHQTATDGQAVTADASANGAASGRALTVGVLQESAPGEDRVALVPESLPRLAKCNVRVLVASGAGRGAWLPDAAYLRGGASVTTTDEVIDQADVLVTVGAPPPDLVDRLREGQTVIGMLRPLVDPTLAQRLADQRVTAISLDGLPRTVSRAQSMDALTSQANVAGYKAVLLAADMFGRFFPLLITAAGTAKPAEVAVLGAGVAGLQAMGTARRLGAMVTGYDIRPETREQIQSVGARFLQLASAVSGTGEGGYARALTPQEQAAQQQELNERLSRFDVVITTAQVPGRRPPVLVTAEAVKRMAAGSVIVDLAASPLGGNVEGSVPEETVLTDNGVRIIGAGNLPAQVPTAASAAFSHNVSALLADLVRDGALAIDLSDEIQAGVVVAYQGKVVHPAVAALLNSQSEGASR